MRCSDCSGQIEEEYYAEQEVSALAGEGSTVVAISVWSKVKQFVESDVGSGCLTTGRQMPRAAAAMCGARGKERRRGENRLRPVASSWVPW
jgi:hypothetical protein